MIFFAILFTSNVVILGRIKEEFFSLPQYVFAYFFDRIMPIAFFGLIYRLNYFSAALTSAASSLTGISLLAVEISTVTVFLSSDIS